MAGSEGLDGMKIDDIKLLWLSPSSLLFTLIIRQCSFQPVHFVTPVCWPVRFAVAWCSRQAGGEKQQLTTVPHTPQCRRGHFPKEFPQAPSQLGSQVSMFSVMILQPHTSCNPHKFVSHTSMASMCPMPCSSFGSQAMFQQ